MAEGLTITIDSGELQRALSKIKASETKKLQRVERVIQETLINIDRKAKKFVPVLSGRLRSSIHQRMENERSGIVFTNVEYASFVEHGTSRQRKQPFMRPAALLEQRSYIAKLKQALK